MIREQIWTWWGMARRRVYDDTNEPTRLEVVTVMLLFSLLCNLAWLWLLSLGMLRGLTAAMFGYWTATLILPAALTLFLMFLGLVLPPSALNAMQLTDFIVLARERGWLSRWDSLIALVAALGVLLGSLRISGFAHWPTAVLVSVLALVGAAGLALFQPAPLAAGRWQITLPPWLPVGKEPTKDDEQPQPEEGAAPLYFFVTLGALEPKPYPVGIRIESSVVELLRRFNQESDGRLYQQDHLAVVLSQGPPASGAGLLEVDRFCLQIATLAKRTRLTRYQFASSILHLVQRNIKYELDRESTQRLLGKAFEEYGRFPLETLHDKVGDCECTAILGAALLSRAGFPCALVQVQPRPGEHHMAVGLELVPDLFLSELDFETQGVLEHEGKKYLYGETAIDDEALLGFGVIPSSIRATMKKEKVMVVPAGSPT